MDCFPPAQPVATSATKGYPDAIMQQPIKTATPAVKDAFLIAETADGQDLSFAWPCFIFRAVKG